MADLILWNDKETANLSLDDPIVLEDYWRLTDITGEVGLFEQHDLYPLAWQGVLENMHTSRGITGQVLEMHRQSGLVEALESAPHDQPTTMEKSESLLIRQISKFVDFAGGDRLFLGGSGVSHFDRPIIRKVMPRLNELLHYSDALDMGITRRQMQFSGSLELNTTYPFVAPKHRAKDDVEQSIATWRILRPFFATFDQESV